jgi:hypothetical protein
VGGGVLEGKEEAGDLCFFFFSFNIAWGIKSWEKDTHTHTHTHTHTQQLLRQ